MASPARSPREVSCLGDSISDIPFRTNTAWTFWLSSHRTNVRVTSDGISGNDTVAVLARLGVDQGSVPQPGAICTYTQFGTMPNRAVGDCFVMVGINDIVFATATAAQMIVNLTAIYAWLERYGWVVYPMTITPFGAHTNWTAPNETIRSTVNTFIKTRPRAIDLDPVVGDFTTAGQPKLAAAFNGGDGLHPSIAGARAIAMRAAQA